VVNVVAAAVLFVARRLLRAVWWCRGRARSLAWRSWCGSA